MLGRNIWTGVLGNISLLYMTSGVLFVAYCHEMGVQKYHFGIMQGLASLTVLLMLLSPAIEEHFGRRKYPWFMLNFAARAVLAPLLLGLFLRVSPWVIVALIVLHTALASTGTALWHSWTWDYIPLPVLARFSARRTFWVRLACTAFFLAAALLVNLTSANSAGRRQLLSGIFVFLFVLGIVDLIFHVRIPEPPRKAPPAHTFSKFLEALKNESFRNWLFVMAIWSFTIQISGPFSVPYMMKELGFENRMFTASILAGAVPAIGALATVRLWGRLLDARHTGLIVAACCSVWSLIPLLFYFATRENAFLMMIAVWGISGIFPAAVTLAIPLMTARLSGLDKTMPAALSLIVMSMGWACGSAVGTLILRTWSVQHAFMASFAGRVTAAFLIFLMLVYRPSRTR